jgi:ubiquitin-protein ligase
MNPDNTIGEEGITEESRLRVGFERRAAAVNPLDRREALLRVRNQVDEYRDSNPGFRYAPNSPALPTEYDIEFIQPSFGPPTVAGEEPTDISVHQLSIVLPPDFPIVAPRVRWLTDIFHPNVYPTYESERLRENPHARGIVCLGTLAESYVPSLDFAELCATLVDIAGFRNYSVWIPAGDRVDDLTGRPLLQGDFYDKDAAYWTASPRGQERILKIGGVPVLRSLMARTTRYQFEIKDVSELDA